MRFRMLLFNHYGIRGARRLAGAADDALVLHGDDNCASLVLEDAHGAGVNARHARSASVLINYHTNHTISPFWNPLILQLSE